MLGGTWAVNSGSTGVTVSTTAGMSTLATVASATLTPTWSPIVGAVGSLNAGNLYSFTVPDTGKYAVTIYLPNVYDLVHGYSFLNMNVTIYIKSATAVETAWNTTFRGGSNGADTAYLTLTNGQMVLYVSGSRYYYVKVTSGSFYCTSSNADYLSPDYYIEISQG